MRILFLSHSANNKNAGASRIYHTLEDGLTARGHTVKTYHYEDFRPFKFRPARLAINRLAMPQFIAWRASAEARQGYDVVMSSSGMGYALFGGLRRDTGPRPVTVNHLHGLALFDHQANLTENLAGRLPLSVLYRTVTAPVWLAWDRKGSAFADLTIVQNDRDFDFLQRSAQPPAQLVCIPPSVHPDIVAAAAAVPPVDQRPAASLLWFGSFDTRKGSYALPAAFDLILDQVPDATLTIGGVHLPETDIRGRFSARAAARIRVLPRISIAEQVAEFGRHAIFLFPSLSEGFGLALVEAMALGLAAVTTSTGVGGDALVHGETAVIVPPSSAIHLARGVLSLITNDALRHAIARRGQALALSFTTQQMVTRYEAAFVAAMTRQSRATTPAGSAAP